MRIEGKVGDVAVIAYNCEDRYAPALKTRIAGRRDLQTRYIHWFLLRLRPLIDRKLGLVVATHAEVHSGLVLI